MNYQIATEVSKVRTTWKSGAMQRSGVNRYFIYRDGLRMMLPRTTTGTGDGGFRTLKAATAWIATRTEGK